MSLCGNCFRSGFCAKHYDLLSPEDQAAARATLETMKRSKRLFWVGTISALVVSGVLFAILISEMFSTPQEEEKVLTAILAVIFSGFACFTVLYNLSITKKGWEKFHAIGQKYKPDTYVHQ